MPQGLDSEAQFLKGVGPRNAAALAKIGLRTVRDVLYHVPRRYEDRRNIPSIGSLRIGQFATVRGRVVRTESRPVKRGGMVILKVYISDRTGTVILTWFNQPWIKRKFEDYQGEVVAYGQIKEASWGYEISSPEWELVEDDEDAADFAKIVPIYPGTEGLSQKTTRRAAQAAATHFLDHIEDPLPPELLKKYRLRPLHWALRELHLPEEAENYKEARKRLVFEEFLYLQLALAMRRAETHQEIGISFPISRLVAGSFNSQLETRSTEQFTKKRSSAGQRLKAKETAKAVLSGSALPTSQEILLDPRSAIRDSSSVAPLWDQIHKMLPFELTDAQKRVIEEIWADMERPHPMNRLVQGDVGSGKTAVAACAMLAAVRSGYQAALMAPTEILAEQHFSTLSRLFEPLGIDVVLLVGKQNSTEKKKQIERTVNGQADIAVGTHALIQEGVAFKHLGLVIVDEQHRFGVLQRAALREKSFGNPDVLVMTATPIPRTLTMTLYGDLDLSVIDELPPGRRPIKTHWKVPSERPSVYGGVQQLISEGRQAYFVCPMVSESEKMNAHAAEELFERLRRDYYPDLRVGLLHGQLKSREKEEVMEQFRAHELDILVSTTVIEVGVDVPNSSVMVIEDANRFGLSQLHQLRGRVGRGEHQSFCIMVADAKSDEARQRMEAMVSTGDGFKIAEIDLNLRGPGELLGTKQSGNLDLHIADLIQDAAQLEVARQAAIEIIEADPTLSRDEHKGMLERVRERRSQMAVAVIS
jgi:ATP-dependent DNA helicase RecG